jgi:NAD(P)-dependent dehydrogenase (short-subunit alcohol dehydrogenase family)
MAGRLNGRTALVTGAASGIGLDIARRFLEEGASVLFTDVDDERLKAAAPEGQPRAATYRADVTEPADAEAAVDMAVRTFGSIDVLVNNAGIVGWTDFADTTIEQWHRVMDVNVTGMFLFAQAAAARMRSLPRDPDRTRSIINLASVEGHVVIASSGHPQVHYNASKGAVVMLTRALAVELAPDGIRVNALAPGVTETPLTTANVHDPARRSWYLDRIPMGRFGRPAEVAGAAVFLASDDASYVTGVSLPVDGGFLAT